MIGKTLGRYKILEPLGAGGMGEVYLAEDTRLKRKVAIKVLPTEFASDSERLARFEQEARAAAALNHPHIAVVFDVGQELVEVGGGDDGDSDSGDSCPVKSTAVVHYMVQEYLEGQTLRRSAQQQGGDADQKDPRLRRRGCRSAGCGARRRHRAPRPEAGQHLGLPGRARQGARLRPGAGLYHRFGGRRATALFTRRRMDRLRRHGHAGEDTGGGWRALGAGEL